MGVACRWLFSCCVFMMQNVFVCVCVRERALVFLLERKKVKSLSHVWLFVTSWAVTYQASPSMGFSRQEYWSGLPFPSSGDLPNPGLPHCRQTLYGLSHQGSLYTQQHGQISQTIHGVKGVRYKKYICCMIPLIYSSKLAQLISEDRSQSSSNFWSF